MKRITALVLTVILLVLLAATPTLAEGGTGEPATPPQAAAEGLRQEEGESTPTDAAVPESGEETPVSPIPEVPEDPAVREELGIADDPVVLTGWAKELADFRSEQGDVLPFGTLRERLEKSNYNVKNLKEQIADLSDISVGSINSAIGELRKLDSALSGALGGIQGMDPALAGTLGLLLQVNSTNIRSQISTLDGQIDSLKVSKRTGENSLKNGIDQIVKGTETLYIAIATMEANLGSIERGLQTLDRAMI